MIDKIEIEIKPGYAPWELVATLYPTYKMGQVKRPWSEPRVVYTNIDEAELEVLQLAKWKARMYLKARTDCKIARIWKYIDGKRVWFQEYYPEDVK